MQNVLKKPTQTNLLQNSYTLPQEHAIWIKMGERLMYYLRDMNYDFVNGMKYFKMASKFYNDFYKEIPPNG